MVEALKGSEKRYFNYLVGYVTDKYPRRSYMSLLRHLYDRTFVWKIYLDKNRAADGLSIRARFFDDDELQKPCSVLEMMIGLADRMENHILWDPTAGDRTGEWFWKMVNNMGLSRMDDNHYDEEYTEECINRMLNRTYSENGRGGLFTVEHPEGDMLETEIWYQMLWWVNENM